MTHPITTFIALPVMDDIWQHQNMQLLMLESLVISSLRIINIFITMRDTHDTHTTIHVVFSWWVNLVHNSLTCTYVLTWYLISMTTVISHYTYQSRCIIVIPFHDNTWPEIVLEYLILGTLLHLIILRSYNNEMP